MATKEVDLQFHHSGTIRVSEFEPRDLQVRVIEGGALAYARIYLSGTFASQPFAGEFQYTRVWLRRESGWQIVSGSATALQPG